MRLPVVKGYIWSHVKDDLGGSKQNDPHVTENRDTGTYIDRCPCWIVEAQPSQISPEGIMYSVSKFVVMVVLKLWRRGGRSGRACVRPIVGSTGQLIGRRIIPEKWKNAFPKIKMNSERNSETREMYFDVLVRAERAQKLQGR